MRASMTKGQRVHFTRDINEDGAHIRQGEAGVDTGPHPDMPGSHIIKLDKYHKELAASDNHLLLVPPESDALAPVPVIASVPAVCRKRPPAVGKSLGGLAVVLAGLLWFPVKATELRIGATALASVSALIVAEHRNQAKAQQLSSVYEWN